METYENGGHAYHATLPTDALTRLRAAMKETQDYGFAKVKAEQEALGSKVRKLFESRGLPSVAAEGFKAPGVVVSYTTDPDIQSGKNSSRKVCKPPPACRCNATRAQTSRPSVWACLAWRSGTSLTAPSASSPPRSTRSA